MFITLEGIDGSGKSTQSERLAQWLTKRTGRETVRTFEPGGYSEGAALRRFILESEGLSPMSELLLFLADRAEHVSKVIAPALNDGRNVVCERWNESTLAYQSGGHKLGVDEARKLIDACNFPEPDVKIWLDVPLKEAITRITSRNKSDKFEAEGLALMERVSAFYKILADNGEMLRIDCGGTTSRNTPLRLSTRRARSLEKGLGDEVMASTLPQPSPYAGEGANPDEVFSAIVAALEIKLWPSR